MDSSSNFVRLFAASGTNLYTPLHGLDAVSIDKIKTLSPTYLLQDNYFWLTRCACHLVLHHQNKLMMKLESRGYSVGL